MDGTEIIVVRGLDQEVVVSCGGHPMIDAGAQRAPGLTGTGEPGDGALLGKRYTAEVGLELLVTKPGTYGLAGDGEPLVPKEAKPLPASD
ncbi:hypothetical protein [Amycolatopsis thermoflava]|uniref:hypothetical protein n=1 Tax=Amycolatopsis thermoflava TaxID=84480 RepID=UPI00382D1DE6